jgi:hypothetical protein
LSLRRSSSRPAHQLPTDKRQADPALREVISAWPNLPSEARARVLAIVRAEIRPAEDHESPGRP